MNNPATGKNLTELRRKHSLHQSKMAEILNISQSMYSRIEKGFHGLQQKHIDILCERFNVAPKYFTQEVAYIAPKKNGEEMPIDRGATVDHRIEDLAASNKALAEAIYNASEARVKESETVRVLVEMNAKLTAEALSVYREYVESLKTRQTADE